MKTINIFANVCMLSGVSLILFALFLLYGTIVGLGFAGGGLLIIGFFTSLNTAVNSNTEEKEED